MASSNHNNVVLAKGTTIIFGSWILTANGSGGFDSRLIDPNALEASEVARRQEIDNFVDQLDEIKLPVHIKKIRDQPDFDTITPKTLSELEEDLDNLLEISRQEAIVV